MWGGEQCWTGAKSGCGGNASLFQRSWRFGDDAQRRSGDLFFFFFHCAQVETEVSGGGVGTPGQKGGWMRGCRGDTRSGCAWKQLDGVTRITQSCPEKLI